jgi:hypothetical protein
MQIKKSNSCYHHIIILIENILVIKLKDNNKLVFETWKQKSVTKVVAVTVGGGVTTMAMKVPEPTPCRK